MLHIVRTLLLLILLCICGFAQAQVRLTSDEAEKLLIDAPLAEYPKIAIVAHATGLVKVEASISQAGLVTSAKAIKGHPLLQNAAVTAVKNYKYKPYLVNDKPASFVTEVYVQFPPGPLSRDQREEFEEQGEIARQFFAVEPKCRDLTKAKKWKEAEESCRTLVRIGDQLSRERALEKMGANEFLGHTLVGQGRYQEAIESYNRAVTAVGSKLTERNAELGQLYGSLAIAHHLLRDFSKALELYRKAEKIYQLAHASIGAGDSDEWVEDRKKEYMKALHSLLRFHLRAAEDSGAAAEVEEVKQLLKTLP